jgi:guanylate kinase
MHKKGKLFVVSGPSGAGKGTIIKSIMDSRDDVSLSVSFTTRSPREGEIHGKNYFFSNVDSFKEMIGRSEFLEYAKVYDNFYGTPKSYVLEKIEKGENVILEIDIQGALQIKENYKEAVFVFILPPSMKELKNRIIHRGSETPETLKKRFIAAFEEISYLEKYNYFIVNDDLKDSINYLNSIIEAEKCRVMQDIRELIQTYKEEL